MKSFGDFLKKGEEQQILEAEESKMILTPRSELENATKIGAIPSQAKDPNFWYGVVFFNDEETMKEHGGKMVILIHSRWKKRTKNPDENRFHSIMNNEGLESLFMMWKQKATFMSML